MIDSTASRVPRLRRRETAPASPREVFLNGIAFAERAFVASEDELRAFVADRLAAFKVPVKVVFWGETLPRNANGKIMKSELKAVFARSPA